MDKIKVLFAGESWFFTTIETKGICSKDFISMSAKLGNNIF